jgi:hypothetical protein
VHDVEGEKKAAMIAELPWDMRGPAGPEVGGPKEWRGQKWRPNSQRYANSGGKNKERYQLWIYMGKDDFYAPKNATGSSFCN